MQSWYQFGYEGFPGGERRRRFYRQRDDPCDSQEDLSNSDVENELGGLDSNSDNDDAWQRCEGWRTHTNEFSAHHHRSLRSRRRRKMETYNTEGDGGSDRPIYYYTLREDSVEEMREPESLEGISRSPPEIPDWWGEDETSGDEGEWAAPPLNSVVLREPAENTGVPPPLSPPSRSPSASSSSRNSVDQFFNEDAASSTSVQSRRAKSREGNELVTMVDASDNSYNKTPPVSFSHSSVKSEAVANTSEARGGHSATSASPRPSPSNMNAYAGSVKSFIHRQNGSILGKDHPTTIHPLGGEERRVIESYFTATTHEDPRLLSCFGASCVSFQVASSAAGGKCDSAPQKVREKKQTSAGSMEPTNPITFLVCYGGAPPYTATNSRPVSSSVNSDHRSAHFQPVSSVIRERTDANHGGSSLRPLSSSLSSSSSSSAASSSNANVSCAFTVMSVSAESIPTPLSDLEFTPHAASSGQENQPALGSLSLHALGNVAVDCRPVEMCLPATLKAVADWKHLHPALRRTNPLLSAVGVAPPRIGHCATALPFSTEEAGFVLAASSLSGTASPVTPSSPALESPSSHSSAGSSMDGRTQSTAREEDGTSANGEVRSILFTSGPSGAHSSACTTTASSLRTHLFLSFVFGGSSALINERQRMQAGGSRLLNCRFGGKTVCMPALCVTVVVEDLTICSSRAPMIHASSSSSLCSTPRFTHHQLYFPLLSGPDAVTSGLEPLAFATMTPWPSSSSGTTTLSGSASDSDSCFTHGGGESKWRRRTIEQQNVISFAVLGGTTNGWRPASLSPVTLVHVDVSTWTWSTSAWLALGAEPAPRFGHSATLIPKPVPGGGQQIVVFGGIGRNREYLNDIFVLDTTSRVWREVLRPVPIHRFGTSIMSHRTDAAPHGRAFHAAVRFPNSTTPQKDSNSSFFSFLGRKGGSHDWGEDSTDSHCHRDTREGTANQNTSLQFDEYLNRCILDRYPESTVNSSPRLGEGPLASTTAIRRPHRLSPIVILGGEGETGLERSVWSLELVLEEEGHMVAQWFSWSFPALRWPRCCMTHRSAIINTARGTRGGLPPRCVLPRVLDAAERERMQAALSFRIKSDTPRHRVSPSPLRAASTRPGTASSLSHLPEHASSAMDFFAYCCGSLPQAVLVRYPRRRAAVFDTAPFSCGSDAPISDFTVSSSMSCSMEEDWRSEQNVGLLILGGTATLHSSFLTTILTPCGKCLRAEARMKLLSMADARKSETEHVEANE